MRARVVIVSLLIAVVFGPLVLLAQQSPAQVVFPDDPKFSELQSAFQEKTKIAGSAWADEFQKRQPFGQVRSSTGITGTLFTEAFALVALVAGQVPYIVYGTIDIPQGAKLAGRDFSGKYGIVVIANPFAAALLDIPTGTIGAFVLLPVSGTTPIFPIAPFLGPVGIFQILFSLITVTPAAPPAPPAPQIPQAPAPTCPQDFPNKSDVNVPITEPAVIATISDTAKLFEIGVAPPAFLTVQSFAQTLQFSYTTALYRRIGIIIGPGSQQIPLAVEVPFALFVTAGQKSACLQATPKLINNVLTIVGAMSTK
jgi:hypothetical protein